MQSEGRSARDINNPLPSEYDGESEDLLVWGRPRRLGDSWGL